MTDTTTIPSTAVIAATAGGHAPAFLATDGAALTTEDARHLTEMIRTTTDVLWWLLARAHRGRAWDALGYDSFTDYVTNEFNISRSRAYQLLNQAKVIEAVNSVTPDGIDVHITEAQARDVHHDIDVVTDKVAAAVSDADPAEIQTIVNDVIEDERATRRAAAPPPTTPTPTGAVDADQPPWNDTPAPPEVELDKDDYLDSLMTDVYDPLGDSYDAPPPSITPPSRPRGTIVTPSDPVTFAPPSPINDPDDTSNAVLVADDPSIDTSLLRARVQAAYDLYSILASVDDMPPAQDVIDVIPPERRLQVTKSLPATIAWLTEFHSVWQQQDFHLPADAAPAVG